MATIQSARPYQGIATTLRRRCSLPQYDVAIGLIAGVHRCAAAVHLAVVVVGVLRRLITTERDGYIVDGCERLGSPEAVT